MMKTTNIDYSIFNGVTGEYLFDVFTCEQDGTRFANGCMEADVRGMASLLNVDLTDIAWTFARSTIVTPFDNI